MTTIVSHFPPYIPVTLKEHYFSDVPAPTAGDDGKALTYRHSLTDYVYTSFDAAGAAAAAASGAATALATHAGVTSGVHGIAAFGATLNATASQAAAQTALGLGTAALLNVGTAANNIVQLNGTAKLPAVDGSLLTNLPAGSPGGSTTQVQYNAAGVLAGDAGMTYDASNDRLTLVGGLIGPSWRPASDSTASPRILNAAGTVEILVINSTAGRAGIGGAPGSLGKFVVFETVSAIPGLYVQHGTNSDAISIVKGAGGSIINADYPGLGSGIRVTGTSAAIALANSFIYAFYGAKTHAEDLRGTIGGHFEATSTRSAKGTNENTVTGVEASASSSITTAGVFGYALSATALTKNITPVFAKTASGATDTDAAAVDIVNASNTRQFGVTPTGRIMTNQATANTNTPSGATAKKIEIFDTAGTSLGFIPIYASAW